MPDGVQDPLPGAQRLQPPRIPELLNDVCTSLGAELETSTLRRIHHRPGRSLSRVDDVVVRRGGVRCSTLLVTHVSAARLPDAAHVPAPDGLPLAAWFYPDDPYLPGLPGAADTVHVGRLLSAHGLPAAEVALRRRAYRPTRRAVVEVSSVAGGHRRVVLYLKVLRVPRARRIAHVHRELASRALPVPGVVLVDDDGTLALEVVAGTPMRRRLVQGGPLPDPQELVRLSGCLGACPIAAGSDPRRFADPASHVGAIRRDFPGLAGSVDDLVAEVRAATDRHRPDVTVHGDLHGGQILTAPDGTITGLLDLDGVGPGAMANDAGNLVSHVEALADARPEAAARATRYAERIAAAYRPVVGAEALGAARAATWLALAASAHRKRDAATVRMRLSRAAAALDG